MQLAVETKKDREESQRSVNQLVRWFHLDGEVKMNIL